LNKSGDPSKQYTLETMYAHNQGCAVPSVDAHGKINHQRPRTSRAVKKYAGNWLGGKKRFYRDCEVGHERFATLPNGMSAAHTKADTSDAHDVKALKTVAGMVGAGLLAGAAWGVAEHYAPQQMRDIGEKGYAVGRGVRNALGAGKDMVSDTVGSIAHGVTRGAGEMFEKAKDRAAIHAADVVVDTAAKMALDKMTANSNSSKGGATKPPPKTPYYVTEAQVKIMYESYQRDHLAALATQNKIKATKNIEARKVIIDAYEIKHGFPYINFISPPISWEVLKRHVAEHRVAESEVYSLITKPQPKQNTTKFGRDRADL
jgi:hypothetical protein